MAHDFVLIVDFGSQVTQLIARRVREAGVFCEIHPFSKASEAFARLKPKAVILSGGPASVPEAGSPRAPAGSFRKRRSDPRHLLRPADLGANSSAARWRAGTRPNSAGRTSKFWILRPVRRRVANGRPLSGMDEPRRSRTRLPEGGQCRVGERALRCRGQ